MSTFKKVDQKNIRYTVSYKIFHVTISKPLKLKGWGNPEYTIPAQTLREMKTKDATLKEIIKRIPKSADDVNITVCP
jgi:hypothetical protein